MVVLGALSVTIVVVVADGLTTPLLITTGFEDDEVYWPVTVVVTVG